MARSGRTTSPDTPLARLIIEDGRPAYIIAALAGLKDFQLSAYCRGRKTPSNLHILRICAVLGCDPDELEDR